MGEGEEIERGEGRCCGCVLGVSIIGTKPPNSILGSEGSSLFTLPGAALPVFPFSSLSITSLLSISVLISSLCLSRNLIFPLSGPFLFLVFSFWSRVLVIFSLSVTLSTDVPPFLFLTLLLLVSVL